MDWSPDAWLAHHLRAAPPPKIGKKLGNKFKERKPLPERCWLVLRATSKTNQSQPSSAPWTTCDQTEGNMIMCCIMWLLFFSLWSHWLPHVVWCQPLGSVFLFCESLNHFWLEKLCHTDHIASSSVAVPCLRVAPPQLCCTSVWPRYHACFDFVQTFPHSGHFTFAAEAQKSLALVCYQRRGVNNHVLSGGCPPQNIVSDSQWREFPRSSKRSNFKVRFADQKPKSRPHIHQIEEIPSK